MFCPSVDVDHCTNYNCKIHHPRKARAGKGKPPDERTHSSDRVLSDEVGQRAAGGLRLGWIFHRRDNRPEEHSWCPRKRAAV